VKEWRLRIVPVFRQYNVMLPCRLPVGPHEMHSCVHVVRFVMNLAVHDA